MGKLNRLVFGDRRDPRQVLAEEFEVPVPTSGSPPQEALRWAQQTLAAMQIDASRDPLSAIRALRQRKNLGLPTTRYLVQHLKNDRPASHQ